ncbi:MULTISPECIES: hypothetical protein [Burkholderia]|uniref:Uncharacterized protein n=1 Tax=Burkholderia anthina TaxID=179879 RepID=A0A7T6VC74_9BURK|nr:MULTISPECIES: hypothetical protein [Burkholderia]MBY4865487.1 hypothetical protein [Burkholderia anthina]QQK01207.1 hypothetical protein JFN94_08740 [Burkholderia anthina]
MSNGSCVFRHPAPIPFGFVLSERPDAACAARLQPAIDAIFRRFGHYDEKLRHIVECIGRFASFFVLELILRVPKLCSWLDAVHQHQTHYQEISA